ncbi:BTB/POZ and MATH domain-containing protein 4 [Camellia lanceoleosa]|uniref:BTB/POZ and MATH domain-containing protein 4 n=1 Tax=Camellia lanceoleosa TaxID=1840588 RepID=A0ACC0GG85_9ERIC|nr:BTB/POZ and MATH domain-containing protein 4 [Camellia lanceoleosa]
MGKSLGYDYKGQESEVIRTIIHMEEKDKKRLESGNGAAAAEVKGAAAGVVCLLGVTAKSKHLVVFTAVMRSDGFEYLKENCPSLQSELLKTLAGCEDDCSSGGGKS